MWFVVGVLNPSQLKDALLFCVVAIVLLVVIGKGVSVVVGGGGDRARAKSTKLMQS